jgi:hypothetical protein
MRHSRTPDLTALAWLRAGTKPKNPLVAARWSKLLAKAALAAKEGK